MIHTPLEQSTIVRDTSIHICKQISQPRALNMNVKLGRKIINIGFVAEAYIQEHRHMTLLLLVHTLTTVEKDKYQ